MTSLVLQAPVSIDLKIHITDGKVEGVVTFQVGSQGSFPNAESLKKSLAEFEKNHMPDGFRLMTKKEFWDAICMEKTGQKFALPGGTGWDAAP